MSGTKSAWELGQCAVGRGPVTGYLAVECLEGMVRSYNTGQTRAVWSADGRAVGIAFGAAVHKFGVSGRRKGYLEGETLSACLMNEP